MGVLDYKDDFDGSDWILVEEGPVYRRYEAEGPIPGTVLIKTEYLGEQDLFEVNRALYDMSDGQRWGDGKIVASVPLNVFFEKLGEAVRQEDKGYIKKWLNNSDNKMYRNFKGNV